MAAIKGQVVKIEEEPPSEIIRSAENNLFTLKGRRLQGGRQQVFLMALAEMERKEGGTEGWILVVSGNPLIPHGMDGFFPNKIGIDSLHVSGYQKFEILQGSVIPSGYVYLYAGKFFVGKCQRLEECAQHDLNVFTLICENLNRYSVEMDVRRFVPFKIDMLSKIILPGGLSKSEWRRYRQPTPERVQEKRSVEKFLYRVTDSEVKVDLECPANHQGYHLQLYMLQTCICRGPDGRRRRVTNMLEQKALFIPPTFSGQYFTAATHPRRLSRTKVLENVKVALTSFKVPMFENGMQAAFPDPVVGTVEFWGIARLLDYKNVWKEFTMTKLLEKGEPAPPEKILGSPITSFKLPTVDELGTDMVVACAGCCKTINLVLFEMQLSP